MTTAARPTFDTARGGQGQRERDLSALSKQYSSRDLPSHTSLKTRDRGQGTQEEIAQRDFKRELQERERLAAATGRDKRGGGGGGSLAAPSEAGLDKEERRQIEGSSGSKKARVDPSASSSTANIDADDPLDDSESDDDDSDSDDDTALLMAELQKIKQEKAMEEMEKEEEKRAEDEKIRMENILSGNPLLKDKYAGSADKSDLRVKRRWDDDVVFKNCSRAEPDKSEKVFINDSLRNEFHKKFMDKYIK